MTILIAGVESRPMRQYGRKSAVPGRAEMLAKLEHLTVHTAKSAGAIMRELNLSNSRLRYAYGHMPSRGDPVLEATLRWRRNVKRTRTEIIDLYLNGKDIQWICSLFGLHMDFILDAIQNRQDYASETLEQDIVHVHEQMVSQEMQREAALCRWTADWVDRLGLQL